MEKAKELVPTPENELFIKQGAFRSTPELKKALERKESFTKHLIN